MIFTEAHAQQMLDRSKWQTRRPIKIGEWPADVKGFLILPDDNITPIHAVYDRSSCLKWQVGKDYASQTGRGKKSIGRTPPIEAIRRERLWDISAADCFGEGIYPTWDFWVHPAYSYKGCKIVFRTLRAAFRHLWNSIYHEDKNIEVWVLVFERAGEAGEG